jgi:hypothetical protein
MLRGSRTSVRSGDRGSPGFVPRGVRGVRSSEEEIWYRSGISRFHRFEGSAIQVLKVGPRSAPYRGWLCQDPPPWTRGGCDLNAALGPDRPDGTRFLRLEDPMSDPRSAGCPTEILGIPRSRPAANYRRTLWGDGPGTHDIGRTWTKQGSTSLKPVPAFTPRGQWRVYREPTPEKSRRVALPGSAPSVGVF